MARAEHELVHSPFEPVYRCVVTVSADDLLRWARLPGGGELYIVGCLDERVSIRSQQVRALNLVWALHASKRLTSGKPLLVVGGGIAGCTAAVAASRLGHDVLLVERESSVLTAQFACTTRWIHPHILSWPHRDAANPNAELPVMNWHEGPAAKAIADMQQQFDHALKNEGRIELILGQTPEPLADPRSMVRIGGRTRAHAAALLCVGFGKERDVSLAGGYWRQDTLEQYQHGSDHVVSGLGDGGLCDALRLRIGGSSTHASFFEWLPALIAGPNMRRLAEMVTDLEQTLDNERVHAKRDDWARHAEALYQKIWQGGERETHAAHEAILVRCRRDTTVELVGDLPAPYSTGASPLHRLLLSALTTRSAGGSRPDDRLSFLRGRLEQVGTAFEIAHVGRRKSVAP